MSEELEQIINRHLLREELSIEERKILDQWFTKESNSHRILGQMRLMLDVRFENERSRIKAETWEELMAGKYKAKSPTDIRSSTYGIKKFLRVAAVLILVSFAGILSQQFITEEAPVVQTERFIEKVALSGQKVTTVLPDGTKVKLNSGSKLVVPEQFSGTLREVTLIGEAFFEVVRDEARPFHVNVEGGLKVVVLGTSFIVDASNERENIVAVRSGRVQVRKESNDESIILEKNEVVRVSGSQSLRKSAITNGDLFFGWVDNKLVLEGANFKEVLSAINEWFGYEIDTRLNYAGFDEYSASLTNPTIKEVMESLSHSYKFRYSIDEKSKRIVIR